MVSYGLTIHQCMAESGLHGVAAKGYNDITSMSAVNLSNLHLFGHKLRLLWWVSLLCCLSSQWGALAQPHGTALTQRRINELAAVLQRARLALIEDTGLRRPQEPLPAYFSRIVGVGYGEAAPARVARIEGYIAALARAAQDTASIRQVPGLRNNDAANLQCWQRAVHALTLFPTRITKARAAWHDLRREETRNWQSSKMEVVAAPYRRLGAELTQAVELLLVAYNALRDARP